jgi:hypothetical protein
MGDDVRSAEPPYECDLIMKGGITSGIVYPPAISEIARDHRLRKIGGTSAGAIAAASGNVCVGHSVYFIPRLFSEKNKLSLVLDSDPGYLSKSS